MPSKHMITLGIQLNKTKSYKKSKENKLPQKNCYPINNLWLSHTEKKRQASKEKQNNFINKIANN